MAKFEKGKSGNPGGRPKRDINVQELARSKTLQAFKVLFEVMRDKDAPWSARVAASREILDRGHGKPLATAVVASVPVDPTAVESQIGRDFEVGRRMAFMLTKSVKAMEANPGLALKAPIQAESNLEN